MKVLSNANTSKTVDVASIQPVIKVCMHVLGSARTDVRVMREASALAENGYEVTIVDIEDAFSHFIEEEISGICVKHIRVSTSFLSTRFTRWPLLRGARLLVHGTLRLIHTPTDIYHAHEVSALPACYIASLLRRKPVVFDSHELPLPQEMSIRWPWVHVLIACLLKYIVPRCAGVITVSSPIAQVMQKRYRVPDVSLIRNVPAYRVIPKSDKLRHYLHLNPTTRIVLFQGYLQAVRRLDLLIRAAKFLDRDIVVVIMGKDIEAIQPHLETLVESEGVVERVKFIPPVPYAELLDWTTSADIGLIVYPPEPSLNIRYSLPNKFFEYLMAGLPILASSLDAISDIIRTYDIGQIVSSLTPADISASINVMLADPAVLATMRSNALNAAQQEFHWEKERQKLFRLYSDILTARNVKQRRTH
jgi:glycosyltransferase involved in cell wall biosynthesis